MDITKEMLSVFKLTVLSLWTFLKALPAIIIVYLVPSLVITAFVSPWIADAPKLFAEQSALPVHLACLSVLKQVINRPEVFVSAAGFIAVYTYSISFTYLYTEGLLNKVKAGLYYVIPNSIASLPRLIAAFFAFLGIIALFLGAPYLPALFSPLTPILSLSLFLLWWLAFIFLVLFSFTGIFFSRVAVLREKWPRSIFYYSHKLVYGRSIRFIVYLIFVLLINSVLFLALKIFTPVLLSLFVSVTGVNSAAAAVPFAVVANIFCAFYYSVALTTYFLNMDYMLNRDNKKMEIFSRAAAYNDNSMPVLK